MSELNTPPNHICEAFNALFDSAPSAVLSPSARPQVAQLDKGGTRLTHLLTKTLNNKVLAEKEGIESSTKNENKAVLERRRAWALRDVASMLLKPSDIEKRGPAVCGCGRAGRDAEEVLFYLNENGTAKVGGVLHCDSAWLCPVCSKRKGVERQERVEEVFDHVKAFGDGQMLMCTLTVRHKKKQSLIELKKAVQEASRLARQGAPWARKKKEHNVLGVISAPEVTYSRQSGWHFHIHTAFVLRGSENDAQDLGEWFVARYLSYVQNLGYDALLAGQDVSVIKSPKTLAKYISKGVSSSRSLAWEMAGNATKRTRSQDSLHPFEILESASGDDGMKALFLEYAAAMKGVRSCIITRSLADALGIDANEDDEEIEEKTGGVEGQEPIGGLNSSIWNIVMNKMKSGVVLAILEDGGASSWPQAEAAAFEIAGVSIGSNENPVEKVVRQHEPSAEMLAREIRSARYSTRTNGEAVQRVLDTHRGIAVGSGKTLVLPPLKVILDLIAA